MPTKTQGTEAPSDGDSYASGFSPESFDIFAGTGPAGEDVEVDEEALEKQANSKKKKKKKKSGFGFG